MRTITGKYTKADVFATTVEQACFEQIEALTNNPEFEGASIKVMPDCHAGKGCTIGTTILTQNRNFSPELVGVDIGCGVKALIFDAGQVKDKFTEQAIRDNDAKIRALIGGRITGIKDSSQDEISDLIREVAALRHNNECHDYLVKQCGTLGSGNHFLEIDRSEDGLQYAIIVHTGSRHLGNLVCGHYTERYHKGDRDWFEDYLHDMRITQQYAARNRDMILGAVAELFGLPVVHNHDTVLSAAAELLGVPEVAHQIESVHNYIEETEDGIMIRKGAIAAYAGQEVIIPLNMHYGTIIAQAVGNPDWNFSLPHGAGRVMSRYEAKQKLALDQFERTMQGIITSSVTAKTLDEAPEAYKKPEEIFEVICDQLGEVEGFKPIYIFKS